MVVLPVMADINFNQNTFKRKTGKKGRGKRFKVKRVKMSILSWWISFEHKMISRLHNVKYNYG